MHSEPVRHTFDEDGGELALSDGARIEVPAGAFTSPTEVTAVLLDVDYDLYLEFPPEARIYRVSTETDVELTEPVVLEVPGPSDDVQVFGFDDGRWTEELLSSASVTTIEIEHFSVTQHLVMTRPIEDGLLSWTLVSSDGFATQTIVNPISLRDHDWNSNFPFPAGPGRGTTSPGDDGPDDETADPGPATTTPMMLSTGSMTSRTRSRPALTT